jgi:hypothetical protein
MWRAAGCVDCAIWKDDELIDPRVSELLDVQADRVPSRANSPVLEVVEEGDLCGSVTRKTLRGAAKKVVRAPANALVPRFELDLRKRTLIRVCTDVDARVTLEARVCYSEVQVTDKP